MLIQELCYLNLVLDGQDMFGVKPFSEVRLSPLLARSVAASLTEKGILADPSSFTVSGAKLMRTLIRYKQAVRYVMLGSIYLGLQPDGTAVRLRLMPDGEDLDFRHFDVSDPVGLVTGCWPELFDGTGYAANPQKLPAPHEVLDGIKCPSRHTMRIVTLRMEEGAPVKTDEVFFLHEGYLCLYDFENRYILRPSRELAVAIITERMAV